MAIAESIGTAIGETVGRVYKLVSDMSVDSLMDLFNSDNSSGRTQKLSFVDNINQAKKGHFEGEMARRNTPVNESCLKYENNLHVNTDGVTSSDTARKALMGDYTAFSDLPFRQAKINEIFSVFNKVNVTGESFIGSERKIRTQEELRQVKTEIDATIGLGNDDLDCLDDDSCQTPIENEMFDATLKKSKELTRLMRARMLKAVLADDTSERYAQSGSNDRRDMLRAQVDSTNPGGPLLNEVNGSTSNETPLVKELLGTEMLTNQLYIELIFEEEKRVLLEALKLQAKLEGQTV